MPQNHQTTGHAQTANAAEKHAAAAQASAAAEAEAAEDAEQTPTTTAEAERTNAEAEAAHAVSRAAEPEAHAEGTVGWLMAELAQFSPSAVVAIAGTEGFAHIAKWLSAERDANSGETLIVISGDDWSRELVVPDAE